VDTQQMYMSKLHTFLLVARRCFA